MVSKAYDLVVFDWEGTLSDTLGQIVCVFSDEAKRMQLEDFSIELAREYIALGPVVAIKKLFPHLPAHLQSDFLEAVQKALLLNSPAVCVAPGALDALQRIKDAGMKLAIATNRGQQSLLRDLESSGIYDFFTTTRTASQSPAKPSPEMLEEIMAVCGVLPERTLMVGDSTSDIEMANQLHVVAIGIDLYYQNEAILRAAGAKEVFNNFQQLVGYLALS